MGEQTNGQCIVHKWIYNTIYQIDSWNVNGCYFKSFKYTLTWIGFERNRWRVDMMRGEAHKINNKKKKIEEMLSAKLATEERG